MSRRPCVRRKALHSLEDLTLLEEQIESVASDQTRPIGSRLVDVHNLKLALQRVRNNLCKQRLVVMTGRNELDTEMNKLFAEVPTRGEVKHQGKTYRRRFFPIEQDQALGTGMVYEWGSTWEPIQ